MKEAMSTDPAGTPSSSSPAAIRALHDLDRRAGEFIDHLRRYATLMVNNDATAAA
jgi:hypothetical protein